MRLSLVVLISLLYVVAIVQSEAPTTKKRPTAAVKATKAPVRQSAYAYLRSVRGNRSCTTGTCPFWERHGRSFAALRCYSQQYQECACLHRMCFSSCMFTREVCNQEMVSCLRQICPRCMPASSLPMCSIYDSMAERVADALSVFACYPCCPMMPNQPANTTSMAASTTTPAATMTETPAIITTTAPIVPLTDAIATTAAFVEGEFITTTGVDGGAGVSAFLPGAEGQNAAGAAAPVAGPAPAPNRNQRLQTTARAAKRTMTTRRLTSATRRPSSTAKTNQVKNIPQANVKTTKKPQANVRPKS